MAYWLVKTEPDSYCYDDLERLGRDRWNGVHNFVAINNIKKMKIGELVFIYHTGKEKSIVGVAAVASAPYPDPDEKTSRFLVVDLEPSYRLDRPVSLKEIKLNPSFAKWELVFQPRLSVMPVSAEYWQLVHDLSKIKNHLELSTPVRS